jgi:hypothetical protein
MAADGRRLFGHVASETRDEVPKVRGYIDGGKCRRVRSGSFAVICGHLRFLRLVAMSQGKETGAAHEIR